ncbi:MAG: hypothetical protein IJS96_09100 [Schwartzia sp.]|nr:hypothetical protein [Schwartzia sp. (in: firmicutes)]
MDGMNFQAGEPFPLPIRAMGDGGLIQADANGLMFILQLSRADAIAVEAFRTGAMELALYEESGVLFFLYRMDGIFKEGWGDAPLGLHLLKPEQRPTEKSLADPTLHLYLVDTRLQILLAMRQVTLNDDFMACLRAAVQRQTLHPPVAADFAQSVQRAWAAHTPDEMRALAVAVQEVPLDPSLRKKLH